MVSVIDAERGREDFDEALCLFCSPALLCLAFDAELILLPLVCSYNCKAVAVDLCVIIFFVMVFISADIIIRKYRISCCLITIIPP